MVATQVRTSRLGAPRLGRRPSLLRRPARPLRLPRIFQPSLLVSLVRRLGRQPRRSPVQPLHQPGHAPSVPEGRRRLRLRVLLVATALHAQQAGDLVLLGLGLMHSWPALRRPREQATAIDFDHRQRGRAGHLGGQLPTAVLDGLMITLLCQFGADLVSQATNVAGADAGAAEQTQGQCRLLEGLELGGQLNDLPEPSGAVTVLVQTQRRPEGGKSPAGRWDSDRRVRCVGPVDPL